MYGDPAKLHVAETAVVNDALFNLSSGEITVGEWAFFGHGVSVLTGTHDWRTFGKARQTAVPKSGRDVVIEEGVWVSSGATLVGPVPDRGERGGRGRRRRDGRRGAVHDRRRGAGEGPPDHRARRARRAAAGEGRVTTLEDLEARLRELEAEVASLRAERSGTETRPDPASPPSTPRSPTASAGRARR